MALPLPLPGSPLLPWEMWEGANADSSLSPKAEACKSIEYAMKKCPNGMYSEIKYDGERVQVHKDGDHFSYFSRSLKPVLPHKVRRLPSFLPGLVFPSAS